MTRISKLNWKLIHFSISDVSTRQSVLIYISIIFSAHRIRYRNSFVIWTKENTLVDKQKTNSTRRNRGRATYYVHRYSSQFLKWFGTEMRMGDICIVTQFTRFSNSIWSHQIDKSRECMSYKFVTSFQVFLLAPNGQCLASFSVLPSRSYIFNWIDFMRLCLIY